MPYSFGLNFTGHWPSPFVDYARANFGNNRDDLTGALACAASYHVYHSFKLGNLPIIQKATETGTFGHVRAFALSSAKAFLNDYDIVSDGFILCIGNSGLKRDRSQLGSLGSSSRPTALNSHSLALVPDS